jgi:5-methyltetrahydrofolate--homocysteine methyltransferase
MTISSEPEAAKVTLEALRQVREKYGVKTVLGVSNISFGLPKRPTINGNFYTLAMHNGLSAGIINPNSKLMMQAYDTFMVLSGNDSQCGRYIEKYAVTPEGEVKAATVKAEGMSLKDSIIKGFKDQAYEKTVELLKTKEAMAIINEDLVPALDTVGKGFEKGTMFLPQLLMSADAAKAGFEAIKEVMLAKGSADNKKATIVIATVKGDIHDIGKNIVKVLLENYSYDVIDLGKDVSSEVVVAKVKETKAPLVGLSALMTTTVVSMEETIKELRKECPWCKIMVGGAVLTKEYADMIGADFYGKDAMQSVYYAEKLFG